MLMVISELRRHTNMQLGRDTDLCEGGGRAELWGSNTISSPSPWADKETRATL